MVTGTFQEASLTLCHCIGRILYATGEAEDLDIDEILRDGHLCLF